MNELGYWLSGYSAQADLVATFEPPNHDAMRILEQIGPERERLLAMASDADDRENIDAVLARLELACRQAAGLIAKGSA